MITKTAERTITNVQVIYEENICAGCGKKYNQPLVTTPFGIICGRFCDECIDKYDAEQNKKLNKQKETKRVKWLDNIGIKNNYIKATLDNYFPMTPSQEEALTYCKMLDNGDITKLVLLGGNGVGKTHLASALVKKHNGLLITAYEMFATYRQCFTGKSSEIDVIKKFSRLSLLAIDEFGRTKGSEAEENFMSAIIDNRHSNNLPTIILSNLIRKRDCIYYNESAERCNNCQRNNCLESRLTKDVISRLRENSKVILIEGDDYRRKNGN